MQPVPTTTGQVDHVHPAREEALLCYHYDAAYYVKVPSPGYGNPGPYFQKITPGSSGHLLGMQFRFYNSFMGNDDHAGVATFGVHLREGGTPGEALVQLSVDTDSISNEVLDLFLDEEFPFEAGQEFFLSMDFDPASEQDTMAMVTASIGQYTGHSFYYYDNQSAWWGDPVGNLFGDMHFCADVWLNDEEAFVHFPWSNLDFGRVLNDDTLQVQLPLTNQGTGPLILHELYVDQPGWSVVALGQDSLAPADTTLLEVTWYPPGEDMVFDATLFIESNALNAPVLEVSVRAGSSVAEILVAEWDEWQVESIQFLDSTQQSDVWTLFQGLNRTGLFSGHGPAVQSDTLANVLAFRDLDLPAGAWLEIRWAQLQRGISNIQHHALAWHDASTGWWHSLHEPDLMSEPWIGEENEWHTVPWFMYGPVEDGGLGDFGFLYAGRNPTDAWYVDDVELILHVPLQSPSPVIRPWREGIQIKWPTVEDADRYLVESLDSGDVIEQFWSTDTCLYIPQELRRGMGTYRVTAFNSFEPPEASSILHSSRESIRWMENQSVSPARAVSSAGRSVAD